MDAIGGDEFAALEVEAGPGLGHAAEGHFLDGLAGSRIHDGGDDTHRHADNDGRAYMSMAAVDKPLKSRCPLCANLRRSGAQRQIPKQVIPPRSLRITTLPHDLIVIRISS